MSTVLQSQGVPDIASPEFLRWVRNEIVRLQQAIIQPATVTNLRATPLAGSIQVDFTRSDGDNYVLYWNTTASINEATRIELGNTNKWVDVIGSGGVKRYYAVKAKKGPVEGQVSSWVMATTLALGTPVIPPEPPPATDFPFSDTESGGIGVGFPSPRGTVVL